MRQLRCLVWVLGLLAAAGAWAEEAPIRHRFLAVDESRGKLHYVDQVDPARGWSITFPGRYRDLQIVGGGRVLVSTASGYAEYDLRTQALLKEVKDPRFAGSASVRRLANGHTLVACNQNGITFLDLDPGDQVVASKAFPELNTLRLFRLSPRGTFLFGCNGNRIVEADMTRGILRQITLEGSKHIYHVLEKPDGHLLAALGYGTAIAELDGDGKVVRTLGGKPVPEGIQTLFYAGFQVLGNGNVVVCNWTGHGPQDSARAPQLLEFSPDGRLVWKWHDPALAGTIHGVILLDGLNTGVLNDDTSSVLRQVR